MVEYFLPQGLITPPDVPGNFQQLHEKDKQKVRREFWKAIVDGGFVYVSGEKKKKRKENKPFKKEKTRKNISSQENTQKERTAVILEKLRHECQSVGELIKSVNEDLDQQSYFNLTARWGMIEVTLNGNPQDKKLLDPQFLLEQQQKLAKIREEIPSYIETGKELLGNEQVRLLASVASLETAHQSIVREQLSQEAQQPFFDALTQTKEALQDPPKRSRIQEAQKKYTECQQILESHKKRIDLINRCKDLQEAVRNFIQDTAFAWPEDMNHERTIQDIVGILTHLPNVDLDATSKNISELEQKIDEIFAAKRQGGIVLRAQDLLQTMLSKRAGKPGFLGSVKGLFLGYGKEEQDKNAEKLAWRAIDSAETIATIMVLAASNADANLAVRAMLTIQSLGILIENSPTLAFGLLEMVATRYPHALQRLLRVADAATLRSTVSKTNEVSKKARKFLGNVMTHIVEPVAIGTALYGLGTAYDHMRHRTVSTPGLDTLHQGDNNPPGNSGGGNVEPPPGGEDLDGGKPPIVEPDGGLHTITQPLPVELHQYPGESIWNSIHFTMEKFGYQHIDAVTNGVKNLVPKEILQAQDLGRAIESLRGFDAKTYADVVEKLASRDPKIFAELTTQYDEQLLHDIERISLGIGATPDQMYATNIDRTKIFAAFPHTTTIEIPGIK